MCIRDSTLDARRELGVLVRLSLGRDKAALLPEVVLPGSAVAEDQQLREDDLGKDGRPGCPSPHPGNRAIGATARKRELACACVLAPPASFRRRNVGAEVTGQKWRPQPMDNGHQTAADP